MEITDLLVKSGQLMLVGMLVVYAFLGVLVLCTRTMSALVQRYHSEQPQNVTAAESSAVTAEVPPQTVAAITAAIHQYRQTKQ